TYSIPPLPFRLISRWGMKQFNRYYFHSAKACVQSIEHFNNPLDSIKHWNRLYGKRGLLQFQGVFEAETAHRHLTQLLDIIRVCQATPTLAVLKYFTKPGPGLLSFARPGFTIAIDFTNTAQAKTAILKMSALLTDLGGKVYLAKDLFLTAAQFRQ